MLNCLFASFITCFVMILVGYIFKKHPYKQIGSNGYSTPKSRSSQEIWDYAQLIAPNIFINYGKIFLLITLITLLILVIFPLQINSFNNLTIFVATIELFIPFYQIETKLSKKIKEIK